MSRYMAQYVVCGGSLHRLAAVEISTEGVVSAIIPVVGEFASTHYLTTEIIVTAPIDAEIPLRKSSESLSEYAGRLIESDLPVGSYPYGASFGIRRLS